MAVDLFGPAHRVEHFQPSEVRPGLAIEADIGPAGEDLPRLEEVDLLHFLDKIINVAPLPAGPTAEVLIARIDVQRRTGVIVEWAKRFKNRAGWMERKVAPQHGDDVARFLDLTCQGCPVFRQGSTQFAGTSRHCRNANREWLVYGEWENVRVSLPKEESRNVVHAGLQQRVAPRPFTHNVMIRRSRVIALIRKCF